MLTSASSSLLISTALPPLSAGGLPVESADTKAAAGFAELLNGLSASLTMPTEEQAAEEQTSADHAAPAAAIAAKTAIETGKILPAALPEAAKEAGHTSLSAERAAEEMPAGENEDTEPKIIAADAALPFLSLPQSERPAAPAAKAAATQTAPSTAAPVVPPVQGKVAGKQGVESAAAEARSAPTVQITATTETAAFQAGSQNAGDAHREAPARPIRIADQARAEMPVLQQPVASAPIVSAPADAAAPAPVVPLATAPAAAPSPFDINAVLDRLVAAREALMPAEAALAVQHSEFGEISIRIEQGSDGRLSAELSAADPELQRAVNAALASERGSTAGGEGDSRPAGQNHARGASTGGDAASGERASSGGERDLNPRRGAPTQQAQSGKSDPNPGVFA